MSRKKQPISPRKQALADAKYRVAKDMFLLTADDNYLIARWCRFEQFNIDFAWLAVHALEKYLKAALLMNGHSSKGYSHDIVRLYEALDVKVAKGLLPRSFAKPNEWNTFWYEEPPEKYLERLYKAGNPDNRYQVFGFNLLPEDLVKLDATVFAVRRLCEPLDHPVVRNVPSFVPDGVYIKTVREVLESQPRYWQQHPGCRLDRAARDPNDTMHHILCRLNFAFAPPSYEHPRGTSGSAMKRAVLYTEILRYRLSNADESDFADALVTWITNNIKMPDDVVEQLRQKVQDERARLASESSERPTPGSGAID